MLDQAKHTYMLSTWSIEKRRNGWYIFKAPFFDDQKQPKGPYGSIMSACMMIARELAKEAVKRHYKIEAPVASRSGCEPLRPDVPAS